jgi:hypothetical protein
MNAGRPTRTALIALATAALAGVVAVAALASVTVYTNDFSSRADVKEINKAGGKKCARKLKNGAMRAVVEKGPTECSFRPPVQGDGILPDYEIRVDGKVGKSIAKSVRRAAFLAVQVRAGAGGVGYTLRVFPEKGRFELVRAPGGDKFPVKGTEEAIDGIGKRNSLRLIATGAVVRALVNGKEVAEVTDPDPGEVSGPKLRFALGNDRDSGKDVVGTFKKLSVAVPEP